jgi:hypothetical protein
MLPLRHEGALAILSYKLVFAHLRLSLKFIVLIESIQIRRSAVRLAGLAKLAQSKEVIMS